jgi:peptide/nickel transport system substrate-binding protein
VKKTPRSAKLVAMLTAGAFVIAACGGSDGNEAASDTTVAEVTEETEAPTEETEAPTEETEAPDETTADSAAEPAVEAAMRMSFTINADAVWEDGTPITWEDVECNWQAQLNTPGSILTSGNDKIISVSAGASDKDVVVEFGEPYAPYKGLLGFLKKSSVEDCNDISEDFSTEMPISAGPYKLDSWSPEQSVFVPNENYWGDAPKVAEFVMVPRPETGITDLKAGGVDFIYPQFYAGITDELADPNVTTVLEYGGDYEAMYMNLTEGRAFTDAAVREAFYKSVDLDALFAQIYTPIAADGELLTCGPIVPGAYCPDGIFGNKYDQAAADTIMTDAGYAKGADGFWAKDGTPLEIKWMINAGNTRRENTQAYLIPLLQAAGWNVIADNCDAACVFQQRLPGFDYDLAMYISTAPPDPAYLVSSFSGTYIPTEENGNAGQNFQSWNNAAATEALDTSDVTIDPAARTELIKAGITEMDKDYILIPLFQFPKSGAYRSDRVGNVDGNLNNFMAFKDIAVWEDVDGDGKIVLGAEQWPECLNPVTECANSSWYVWTVSHKLLPNVYDTTNDGQYVLSNVVDGEPVVEVL